MGTCVRRGESSGRRSGSSSSRTWSSVCCWRRASGGAVRLQLGPRGVEARLRVDQLARKERGWTNREKAPTLIRISGDIRLYNGRGMFEIGNSLREAREHQGLDYSQVELATKIRAKYIQALEDEHFEILPSGTYIKGFLRSYSEYLGLDGQLYV